MFAWASLPPACRQSAYHMLFWLHHSNAPHAQTSEAFSLSKWGRGPQAEALPVARLTLPWPHPLAWYCRSVWSWPYHCVKRTFLIYKKNDLDLCPTFDMVKKFSIGESHVLCGHFCFTKISFFIMVRYATSQSTARTMLRRLATFSQNLLTKAINKSWYHGKQSSNPPYAVFPLHVPNDIGICQLNLNIDFFENVKDYVCHLISHLSLWLSWAKTQKAFSLGL